MFNFACRNWPDHKIIIKVHPDVLTQKNLVVLIKIFMKKMFCNSELGQINKLIDLVQLFV